jgi:hypothetical protein
MQYEQWETCAPERIKREPVWRFAGYRKALYLHDLVWDDTEAWLTDT